MFLACLGLVACGGGGGGGGSGGGTAVGQPWIGGEIKTFPPEAGLPGLGKGTSNTSAIVYVLNQARTESVANATVTANGVLLRYDPVFEEYSGLMDLNPAQPITINVTIDRTTYTAVGAQLPAFPTIVSPEDGATWSRHASNLVSWTGTAPDPDTVFALMVLDPDGVPDWPEYQRVSYIPHDRFSERVDGFHLGLGERYVLLGLIKEVPVAGAQPGSSVIVGGFDYATVTVAETSDVLTAITTSPDFAVVGVGKSRQLTATGDFDDYTTADITADVTWSSSDTAVVTVSTTGAITGVGAGDVTVTATKDGLSDSTLVTVVDPSPLAGLPMDRTVAYQVDYSHTGRATVGPGGPTLPPSAVWSITLDGTVSYPVVVDGKAIVTTFPPDAGTEDRTSLHAIDLATGQAAWGPITLPGQSVAQGPAYAEGHVFVTTFLDATMHSYEAASGAHRWSVKLPPRLASQSPPTAAHGLVYQKAGDYVVAVHQGTGQVLWTTLVSGTRGSPAVSQDGVFDDTPCQVFKLDPIVGSIMWHLAGPCTGGGGTTPVVMGERLFVRSLEHYPIREITVLDSATGARNASLPAHGPPAVGASAVYFLESGTLQAVDLATYEARWSFAGDGALASAPLLLDDVVLVGSETGLVYALDAANGSLLWTGRAGEKMLPYSEDVHLQPYTGFGVGDGYLVVPAGNVLSAWRIIP